MNNTLTRLSLSHHSMSKHKSCLANLLAAELVKNENVGKKCPVTMKSSFWCCKPFFFISTFSLLYIHMFSSYKHSHTQNMAKNICLDLLFAADLARIFLCCEGATCQAHRQMFILLHKTCTTIRSCAGTYRKRAQYAALRSDNGQECSVLLGTFFVPGC